MLDPVSDNNSRGRPGPFNSLFEMPAIAMMAAGVVWLVFLSILYLRCFIKRQDLKVDTGNFQFSI